MLVIILLFEKIQCGMILLKAVNMDLHTKVLLKLISSSYHLELRVNKAL